MVADGSVVIEVDVDVSEADKEFAKLTRSAEKLESEIEGSKQKKLPLVRQLEQLTVQADAAAAKLYEMQNAPIGTYSATQIEAQKETVRALGARWDDVHKKITKCDTEIQRATERLSQTKEKAGQVAKNANSAAKSVEKMGNATKKANKHMGKFALRLREVVRSALVFTLITQSLAKFREWVGKVIKTDEKAVAAIAELKGALLTLAQPLTGIIIPALTGFVRILTQAVLVAARLVSALFGKTIKQSADAAEELNKETDAINGLSSAAKEAKSALAGFDEVNQITTESAAALNDQIIAPDFSAVSSLPQWLEDIVSSLEVKLQKISFAWDPKDVSGQKKDIETVLAVALGSILGAVFGGIIGGIPGAVIGLLLGALISLVSVQFKEGKLKDWKTEDTLIVVLSALLGATLGAVFGGIKGGAIGLILGALISFSALSFAGDKINKGKTVAALRVALLFVLGVAFGSMFGGLTGTVIGAMLGLTIGFASIAFDKNLDASIRSFAQKSLTIAITTMIGSLIGAVFGGGVFGGIVGGVIGLTFGLAITFSIESFKVLKDKVPNFKGIGPDYSWMFQNAASVEVVPKTVPGLASGSVIPPNRKFLAVLGDNKTETEVVSPLSTMKQAFMDALRESGGTGGGTYTFVVNLDGKEIARNQVKHINDMTIKAGKPVLIF